MKELSYVHCVKFKINEFKVSFLHEIFDDMREIMS